MIMLIQVHVRFSCPGEGTYWTGTIRNGQALASLLELIEQHGGQAEVFDDAEAAAIARACFHVAGLPEFRGQVPRGVLRWGDYQVHFVGVILCPELPVVGAGQFQHSEFSIQNSECQAWWAELTARVERWVRRLVRLCGRRRPRSRLIAADEECLGR